MKYKKIPFNETIIIYNGFRYVLEQVVDIQKDETKEVCYYCDLQTLCKHGDGNLKFLALCMPNHVGASCCFRVNIDNSGNKIHDIDP